MNFLSSLGGLSPVVALLAGGALLGLLWLGWRKPTWLLMIALASLAIRFELLWGGASVDAEWGLQHTLLVVALFTNAVRHGLRIEGGWPLLALIATFGLGLAFGDLYPGLTLPFMLECLAVLALPFAFTQVVLEPGSRRQLALCIALTPALSVALGALLQTLDVHPLMFVSGWNLGEYRLHGAAGIAAVFGMLAFAGFAVALHEATRPGRRHAGYLAAANLVLLVLSGTRMAMLAAGAFLVAYALASPDLRMVVRQQRQKVMFGAAIVAIAVAAYWPSLALRLFAGETGGLELSGRDALWSFYLGEFWLSPWFGRGIGTGFLAGKDALSFILNTPHNEYLHLLVSGGIVGFALTAGAIGLWYRDLLGVASPNDRGFLLALIPALLLYASTDNLLTYPTALALFAYLGVLLTRPSPVRIQPDLAVGDGQGHAPPTHAAITEPPEGEFVSQVSTATRSRPPCLDPVHATDHRAVQ